MIVRILGGEPKGMSSNSLGPKFRSTSCQTDFEEISDIDFPIFFATLFASLGEAATQCCIPAKANKKTDSAADVSKKDSPKEKTSDPKTDNFEETIEEVVRSCRDDDDSLDSSHSIDNFDAHETDQGPTEDQDSACETKPVQISDGREVKLTTDDEGLPSKKVKKKQTKKKRKKTDSDFSSDDDTEFWKRMKKKMKTKRFRCKKNQYKPLCFDELTAPLCDGNIQENSNVANESTDLEKSLLSQKLPEIMKMDDGDWITDDEEDEENFDLEMAFRDELKKKRLPMNSKEKNFICEVCGKRYSKNHLLREHIVREHRDHQQAKKYPYQCGHCKRVYSGEKQLQTHLTQFSGPCEICGMVVGCSGLFWYHRKNHEAECSICNKVFSAKATLIMHMKTKHMEKKFSCPECHRKFSFESQLAKHTQNVHNQGEPREFSCKECSFVTNRKTALRAHERSIHKIRKIYSCSDCKGNFKRRSSLENHRCGTQSGQKHLSCKICLDKFVSFADLSEHEKSAHGIQVTVKVGPELEQQNSAFFCQMCHSTFPSSKALQIHALKTHGIVMHDPKTEAEESIQITEVNEAEVSFMHIDVNNEVHVQTVEASERIKEDDSILGLETAGDGFPAVRSALSVPAYVVPPDVNMVEIDGVQYHVIRGNQ